MPVIRVSFLIKRQGKAPFGEGIFLREGTLPAAEPPSPQGAAGNKKGRGKGTFEDKKTQYIVCHVK